MAKKKSDIFTELANVVGGELLSDREPVKMWVDTGNLALNFLCSGRFMGGGVPSGKIVEIFGNSSTCKTLFGTNILFGAQKSGGIAVFLDAENSLNRDFAEKASHLDSHKVIRVVADSLEKAFSKIHTVIRRVREVVDISKPIVIVYDSIAASPSEREFAETMVEEEATDAQRKAAGAGPEKPGERAKVCSAELRKLGAVLDKNNASVIFINQVRDKIGVLWGAKDTTAGGGRALEFYSDLRLRTRASTKLKDNLDNVIGMKVSVRNEKNKCFRPHVEAEDMHLFYDKGINPLGGLLKLLVQNGRVEGKGTYHICKEWADEVGLNGESRNIKFKASKEKNEIPPDILIRCPFLVDASDPKEVEEYLSMYCTALEASDNDINNEEKVSEMEE